MIRTGAWLLPDDRPLRDELEAFLDAGGPPVYFGLGSMRAPGGELASAAVASARALGHRVAVSQGRADLAAPDKRRDVNHRELFRRVAAVVHHRGAGASKAWASGWRTRGTNPAPTRSPPR